MKWKTLRVLLGLGALLGGGLVIRGCGGGGNGYLAELGLSVPSSVVVSHQSFPSLTSDEDLLILQLSPAQVPSFLSQLRAKRDFSLAPAGTSAGSIVQGRPAVTGFFAKVPKRARVGEFRVDHNAGQKDEWPTFCNFAVDPQSGRVWLYGWSVYN